MIINTALKRVAYAVLVLSVGLATVTAAAARGPKPIVRDHRSPTWTPKTNDKKNPPVVRDHRNPPWQPRPHGYYRRH